MNSIIAYNVIFDCVASFLIMWVFSVQYRHLVIRLLRLDPARHLFNRNLAQIKNIYYLSMQFKGTWIVPLKSNLVVKELKEKPSRWTFQLWCDIQLV